MQFYVLNPNQAYEKADPQGISKKGVREINDNNMQNLAESSEKVIAATLAMNDKMRKFQPGIKSVPLWALIYTFKRRKETNLEK